MEFFGFLDEVLQFFFGVFVLFVIGSFIVVGLVCFILGYLLYKEVLIVDPRVQQFIARSKHTGWRKGLVFLGAMSCVFLIIVIVAGLFAFVTVYLPLIFGI